MIMHMQSQNFSETTDTKDELVSINRPIWLYNSLVITVNSFDHFNKISFSKHSLERDPINALKFVKRILKNIFCQNKFYFNN